MTLRDLTPFDIEAAISLGARMHKESVYRDFDYDKQKCGQLLYRCLSNPDTHFAMVTETDGKLTGMLLGYISEHYFGRDLIASDYLWYVLPEHRGSRAGLQLLIAFQDWAKVRNAAEVYMGISSGLHAEKTGALLTKIGYDVVGGNYKLRVVK